MNHLTRIEDGMAAMTLAHSRAIAAPKREPKKPAPLHPMCLAMGRAYLAQEDARKSAARKHSEDQQRLSQKLALAEELLERDGGDGFRYLAEMRGGCRCSHPNSAPPCGACTEPMDEDEADAVIERFGDAPAAKPGSDCTTVTTWRRGCDIPQDERVGLWHVRKAIAGDFGAPARDASTMSWRPDIEYRPAAPGTQPGDAYDESRYATPQPAAAPVKPPLLWRRWSR